MTEALKSLSEQEVAVLRESDWKELHWRLRSIAQERVALEAKETGLLIEAEESHLYRRLGYATMTEYMERELHWGPHAANERLRVARELMALPLIAETFQRGEMCFSAVRELTRVATPENEHEFLSKAQGRTARDVERMVAGLRRGDSPGADPDPKLIKKKIFLEVSAATWARYRRTRTAHEKAHGGRLDDTEFLEALLREAAAPEGVVTKPAVQVAVTTCKGCKKNFVAADGEQVPIDDVTADWLTCDSVFMGDLESNDLTRPKSHIPNAIRAKVMQRDGYGCIVPGCRAKRNLDVHHFRHRQFGGKHTTHNCGTVCSGHHAQHHDGRLEIYGSPGAWTFIWHTDEGVLSATTDQPWVFVDEDDAPLVPTIVRERAEGHSAPRGIEKSAKHVNALDGELVAVASVPIENASEQTVAELVATESVPRGTENASEQTITKLVATESVPRGTENASEQTVRSSSWPSPGGRERVQATDGCPRSSS